MNNNNVFFFFLIFLIFYYVVIHFQFRVRGTSEFHIVSVNLLHTFGTYSGFVIVDGEKFEFEVIILFCFVVQFS